MEQIDRDVMRTHPDIHFFSGDSSSAKSNQVDIVPFLLLCFFFFQVGSVTYILLSFLVCMAFSFQEALRNILIIYAKLNPGVRYVQGMNEILAPLFYIFKNDPNEENGVGFTSY